MAHWASMSRRNPRLSTRVTFFFVMIALLGGAALTVTTYVFARNSLLSQREAAASNIAISHAENLQESLIEPSLLDRTLRDLDIESGGFAVVLPVGFSSQAEGPREFPSRTGISINDFPTSLVDAVLAGESAQQVFVDRHGNPQLGMAIAMTADDANYLEAFPLRDTESTLRVLGSALIVGSVLAVLLAGFFGWSVSRRLLQPISRVADAAEDIADGALDARLEPENDPELARLAVSFNDMADAVQERIEREQRFASDVSHELRSPITALTAAVEVLDKRRGELTERTQQALDVVVGQVRRFDDMVIDLLELSRLDAGAHDLNLEKVDLADLCKRICHRVGYPDLAVETHRRADHEVVVDRLRFERILTNLLENASAHGDGPVRISIEPGPVKRSVLMVVEDAGPGVAASEQTRIFERFARGSAARHRIGTGLGLALVAEHATALGGEAWVENRVGGGARFVVRLATDPRDVEPHREVSGMEVP